MSRNQGDLGPTIYSIERLIELSQSVELVKPNKIKDHYIETGFNLLDNYLYGFRKGDLVVIGGAQAMGLSAFILSMMHYISEKTENKVRFFSLDEDAPTIFEMLRMIHTEKSRSDIEKELSDENKKIQLSMTTKELLSKKLIVDDDNFIDYIDLIERIRHDQQFQKSTIFVIDYIQLLGECGSLKKEMNLCLKALKNIAVELNCVIFVLSRISTKVLIKRKKRIPKLSDLKVLGNFDKYADFIGLLHRPEYWGVFQDKKKRTMAQKMFMYVKKTYGRNQKDKVPFQFLGEYHKVKDVPEDFRC